MRFNLKVVYEDGKEEVVSAGQRELADWERQPFGCSAGAATEKSPMLLFRFLAFSALKRQWRLDHIEGKPATFDAWTDLVFEVNDDDDAADEDPTKTDQSPAD